jgi:hypothetical protein
MKAAKLLLVEETRKNFRLRDVFAEQFGKDFNEKEVEQEINDDKGRVDTASQGLINGLQ